MKKIISIILFLLLTLPAFAQGVKQTGWTTNTSADSARTALGLGSASSVTFGSISGDGSGITHLTPLSAFSSGFLPSYVKVLNESLAFVAITNLATNGIPSVTAGQVVTWNGSGFTMSNAAAGGGVASVNNLAATNLSIYNTSGQPVLQSFSVITTNVSGQNTNVYYFGTAGSSGYTGVFTWTNTHGCWTNNSTHNVMGYVVADDFIEVGSPPFSALNGGNCDYSAPNSGAALSGSGLLAANAGWNQINGANPAPTGNFGTNYSYTTNYYYKLVSAQVQQGAFDDTAGRLFADRSGITALDVRNDLSGFAGDLQTVGVLTNLVDAMLFQSQYNPTNHLSFRLRPISAANDTYGRWGAALSAGNVSLNLSGLPDCKTNTLVCVWRVPLGTSDGNEPGRFLAGVFDTTGREGLYQSANGAYGFGYRIRAGGRENITSGDGKAAALNPWSIFAYDTSSTYIHNSDIVNNGNKIVTASCYDGASLSGFCEFWQTQIGYLNPSFSTNWLLAGIRITNSLTQLQVGSDVISTNTVGAAKSDCLEVLLFNKVLNYTEYKGVVRAINRLDRGNKATFFIGDSTVSCDGVKNGLTATNSVAWMMKKNKESQPDGINFIDYSTGGGSYSDFGPVNLNGNRYKTNILMFSEDFWPHDKYTDMQTIACLGLNDFYGGAVNNWAGLMTNVVFLNDFLATNGVKFAPSTAWETASNGTVLPWASGSGVYESNRLVFNNMMITNQWRFSGGIKRVDQFRNQQILATNSGIYTTDGAHPGTTNAWIISQRAAAYLLGIYQ